MSQQIYRYNYKLNTIEFGDDWCYSIEMPPIPPKSDILFSDLPKKEQYWRRNEKLDEIELRCRKRCEELNYPLTNKNLTRMMTNEDRKEVEKHISRRINGVFFMNNGNIEWIPPHSYFYLQSVRDSGTKQFKKAQVVFEFMDMYVSMNEYYLAWFAYKVRRIGGTDMICAMNLNEQLLCSGRFVSGFMANSAEQIKKTWDLTYKNMYETLPFYDTRENITKAKKELIFKDNKTNSNQTAFYIALNARGFDGKTTERQFIDELLKFELDVNSMMDATQKACTKDSTMTRIGWVRATSTVTEEVLNEKWIPSYSRFWDDASPKENKNRCARLYVGGQYSINIDKYGEVDVEANMAYIASELAKKTNYNSKIAYMRSMSTSPEQGFRMQQKASKLGNLKEVVDSRVVEIRNNSREYVMGNFESITTNAVHHGVKFVPAEGNPVEFDDTNLKARWQILNGYLGETYYFKPNKVRKHYTGSYKYEKDFEHLLCIDAYTFDNVPNGGSKGGAVVGKVFNHSNSPYIANIPLAVYNYRPSTLLEFYRDMVNAAIWFGCPISFERQNLQPKFQIADTLKQNLMLLVNQCSHGDTEVGEKPSAQFTIDAYQLIGTDIMLPDVGEVNILQNHHFPKLLEQIAEYDGTNKKVLDVFSAWCVFKKVSNVLIGNGSQRTNKLELKITINN